MRRIRRVAVIDITVATQSQTCNTFIVPSGRMPPKIYTSNASQLKAKNTFHLWYVRTVKYAKRSYHVPFTLIVQHSVVLFFLLIFQLMCVCVCQCVCSAESENARFSLSPVVRIRFIQMRIRRRALHFIVYKTFVRVTYIFCRF